METETLEQLSSDYYTIEKAIRYLDTHFREHPSLQDVADRMGLSPWHFHRVFRRWAGITPDRFQKYLTLGYAKQQLRDGKSVLDAAYEAGLSSPGRLHDLFVAFEAVTPGQYKSRGESLTIAYGFHPTPFGQCLLGLTERGICALGFCDPGTEHEAVLWLQTIWPAAVCAEDAARTGTVADSIFSPPGEGEELPFNLYIRGTNFQVMVWQALLSIPGGVVVSYGDLASFIGNPRAVRAVAGAVAANPVSYLIPCHRVIAASGSVHGYHWKPERKRLILAREAAVCLDGRSFETA